MISNIFLHEVLDKWFEETVKPRLYGQGFLIRFADDFVMGFSLEKDARRIMKVLPKRFEKFGLKIHSEKTRLLKFLRPNKEGAGDHSRHHEPHSFDFLGFNHHWGLSRRGYFVVKRKTAKDRMRRALKRVSEWCRRNRHLRVWEQHYALAVRTKGHYAYYGITGNGRSLGAFRCQVERIWRKWLNRRSQRKSFSWEKFRTGVLKVYPIPAVRVVHSIYAPA